MPYLLFLKKWQHLKLSPAVNYRWRLMGHPLNASYIPKQQNVGNKKSSTPILYFEDPNFSVFARQSSRKINHGSLKFHNSGYFRSGTLPQPSQICWDLSLPLILTLR